MSKSKRSQDRSVLALSIIQVCAIFGAVSIFYVLALNAYRTINTPSCIEYCVDKAMRIEGKCYCYDGENWMRAKL